LIHHYIAIIVTVESLFKSVGVFGKMDSGAVSKIGCGKKLGNFLLGIFRRSCVLKIA
jgi:hypothetical protein